MANLVETIMDRVKTPDKIELSPADRQLLFKLAAAVDELKEKKTLTDTQLMEAEGRLIAQMQRLFDEAVNRPEPPAEPPVVNIDLEGLKRFVSESSEQDKYQLKAYMEDNFNGASTQLRGIRSAIKDEEILNRLPALCNQINALEAKLSRQMRTVKIMTGFTIWVGILTLAVAAAHVLGYL